MLYSDSDNTLNYLEKIIRQYPPPAKGEMWLVIDKPEKLLDYLNSAFTSYDFYVQTNCIGQSLLVYKFKTSY